MVVTMTSVTLMVVGGLVKRKVSHITKTPPHLPLPRLTPSWRLSGRAVRFVSPQFVVLLFCTFSACTAPGGLFYRISLVCYFYILFLHFAFYTHILHRHTHIPWLTLTSFSFLRHFCRLVMGWGLEALPLPPLCPLSPLHLSHAHIPFLSLSPLTSSPLSLLTSAPTWHRKAKTGGNNEYIINNNGENENVVI